MILSALDVADCFYLTRRHVSGDGERTMQSRGSQSLTGRMQLAFGKLVEESCLRPEAVEVRLAERLPLIAGPTIVVVPRC
jgi:hypothetical protein